jgi:hypothetical protein
MATLLIPDLSPQKKALLAAISGHEGFFVLKEIMEEMCRIATAKTIQLDPMVDNYDKKLASLQQTARAMNDFSSSLLKTMIWHADEARSEQSSESLIEAAVALVQKNKQ